MSRTAAVGAVTGYLTLQWLGRTWGATREERHRRLPGDRLTRHPLAVTTHAITVNAPPAEIWPWLVQMGWHRGGWYTAEWVDRLLFPANGPGADRVIPGLQDIKPGDSIPDGPPQAGCEFTVADLEENRHLILHSEDHLPPGWTQRYGAWIDWTWAFVLDDLGDDRTRFIVRSRLRTGPWWVAAAYLLAIIPADFVMSRQMLRGVRARAERPGGASPRQDGGMPTREIAHGVTDVLSGLPLFVTAPLLRHWHLRWGATREEALGPMPGDELVPDASFQATRAITIAAPPALVWPWIVQMGYRRAGFYTYALLDNAGYPSADRVLPEYQQPKVGDWMPMAGKVNETTAFKVRAVQAGQWLLWEKPDSTWSWTLTPLADGRTRLVSRLKQRYAWQRPGSAMLTMILLEFGDFPMMRRVLRGIKARAEQMHSADLA